MQPPVETFNLTKFYPKIKGYKDLFLHPVKSQQIPALHNVNLRLEKGGFLGILGPNGAGKTTLIKILSTLVYPTSGRAMVNGFDVVKQGKSVRKSIGLIINEERSFYWRLTGRQNLEFFATLNNISPYERDKKIKKLLALTDLEKDADRMFKDYSTGTKQKLSIARGLLCDPAIIFLDEPTRSLDPQSAKHLRTFIRDDIVCRHARTAILATHNLQEAEELCSHFVFLKDGRIIVRGTVDEIKSQLCTIKRYTVRLSPSATPIDLSAIPSAKKVIPFCDIPGTYEIESDDISHVMHAIISRGGKVEECFQRKLTLEDIFLKIVEEQKG